MHHNSTESKVIATFTANPENTMNRTVSNSVGMALLHLKSCYPDKLTEEAFLDCRKEIEALAATKSDEVKLAVQRMMTAALEAQSVLDRVTLRFKKPSTSDNESISLLSQEDVRSELFVFPLKEVLSLTWAALKDDSKFAHHYAEEKTEAALQAAATSHRENRLESFFNRLQEISSACHHGKRNGLVSLLDHSCQGINLIINEAMTVSAFLRDKIKDIFWEKYEDKEIPLEQKNEMNAALIKWINTGRVVFILKCMGIENEMPRWLQGFFLQHGVYYEATELYMLFFHDPNARRI